MDTQHRSTWLGILLTALALVGCSEQGLSAAVAAGSAGNADSDDTAGPADTAGSGLPQLRPIVPNLGCPRSSWSQVCWTRYPETDGTQTIYAFNLDTGAACVAGRLGSVDGGHQGDLIRYEDSWVFQGGDGALRVHDDTTVEEAWFSEHDGPMVLWRGGFGVLDGFEADFRWYPDWDALVSRTTSTDTSMWPAVETLATDGVNIFGAWHASDDYDFHAGGPSWSPAVIPLQGWDGWILGLGSVAGSLIVTDGGFNADHTMRVVTYDPGTGNRIAEVRPAIPGLTAGLWCEDREP